ncbi:MAG: HAD family hydrolase [Gemmatimonadaceae bacterium]
MIRAVVFDLDGTLVETEVLKARSYAEAAVALRPDLDPRAVEAAYTELVGRSREEVVDALVRRFSLADAAAARARELGAATPQEAFAVLRTRIYERMIEDPSLIRAQAYPEAIELLRRVRAGGFSTALATMSYRHQVTAILDALGIADRFDAIATRDDVARPKPDPEIYRLVVARLGLAPGECLAIEDSLPGIQSALAGGLDCVSSTSPLTRAAVHAAGILPPDRIVDDPARLRTTVVGILEPPARARRTGT